MASVTLQNLRKSYGNVEIIHGINVAIEDGEFIVIVGPSGCGKSTLLRMVAGLETVNSGHIQIGGRQVEKLEPRDRDIAMVFQNYALYPHMTVYDNMAYGLKMRRVPKVEISDRVLKAAKILEITQYLSRRPRNLSGGQRQRVAMGRAIVRNPAVFLFDEPLSNLDAKLRVQMRLEIKTLQQQLGTTSIYVTHDQVEAMTLADRLIVMNGGKAEQIGRPMDLYDDPATTFVASFIGSPPMNLVPACIAADGASAEIVEGACRLPLAIRGFAQGQAVLLGMRPEHMQPTIPDAPGAIPIDLHAAEPLGADTLVYGRIGKLPGIVAVRLPGHDRSAAGERRWFTAASSLLAVFDATTGQRLRSVS